LKNTTRYSAKNARDRTFSVYPTTPYKKKAFRKKAANYSITVKPI
jgi:hypothetical protein